MKALEIATVRGGILGPDGRPAYRESHAPDCAMPIGKLRWWEKFYGTF